MFKLVLEKSEEPEIKWPTSTGSSKKQNSSRKTSISVLLTMPMPLTVLIRDIFINKMVIVLQYKKFSSRIIYFSLPFIKLYLKKVDNDDEHSKVSII